MEAWLIWMIAGGVLVLSELIIPGAITIFLGISALIVGGGIKLGYFLTTESIFMAWIGTSLVLLLFVRTFFLRFFEGDSTIHNVDEEKDAIGSLVEVYEDILPYKEGRVHFRGSTWQARSDEEINKGSKAIIIQIDGAFLIVKSI